MTADNPQVSDEELARQAQAGSVSSFEELVYRYEARIYRFVANTCRDSSDAQEVTQDAFVTAYRAMGSFDAGRSFATWLFTIARRKCIDHHRAARPTSEAALPEATDGNDPAELLAQREAEQGLWQLARRVLPQLQFEALWLKCAEDLSVAEVARVLRRTRTHVKVLLFRGRLRLERELTQQRAAVAASERDFARSGNGTSGGPSQHAPDPLSPAVAVTRIGVTI